MALVLLIGGQGDGKSIMGTAIEYKASLGKYDPILRVQNIRPYTIHSNCALYFCHPPIKTIDTLTGDIHLRASCKCPNAQKNGDLNPLSLLKKVKNDTSFLYYTACFFTEFHRWADSHLSMQLPANLRVIEMLLEYLIDESRKRRFRLVMDTQQRMKISNRIRDGAGNGYIVLCKNYAMDKEGLDPKLEYIVIKDVLSWRQQYWVFRPGPNWVRFYGDKYNSWETPSRMTQVEMGWGGLPDIPDDVDSVIGTTEEKADADILPPIQTSGQVREEISSIV